MKLPTKTPTSQPSDTAFPDVLKVDDAARVLNCSANYLRELLRTRALRGFKIGQQWRITLAAVREFIESAENAEIP